MSHATLQFIDCASLFNVLMTLSSSAAKAPSKPAIQLPTIRAFGGAKVEEVAVAETPGTHSHTHIHIQVPNTSRISTVYVHVNVYVHSYAIFTYSHPCMCHLLFTSKLLVVSYTLQD